MTDTLKLILWLATFPVMIAVARRQSVMAARMAVLAVSAICVAWVVTCGLGIAAISASQVVALHEAHRYAAHGFIIVIWLCFPVAVAPGIAAFLSTRSFASLRRVPSGVLLVLLSFMLSFTGYLGPSHGASVAGIMRFRVLHEAVVPIVSAVFLARWFLGVSRAGTSKLDQLR